MCIRDSFGAMPPKGQEMDDHYFGTIRQRISAYMKEVNEECWKLGVTAKTQHNEVAPAQHELAPIYAPANIAADHNQIMMRILKKVASRHGMRCLLHEKPFAGVNGSGKTMLMRAISGLINPDEGYVKIGEKIIGKDISFPESIGLLLEYPGFVRKYSGFKNLKMIASLKGIAGDNQIKNTMIKTGLNPENKKSFGSYSLGMKQKLGIACAIMENPELIILDEPVNALDEFSIKNIAGIIEAVSYTHLTLPTKLEV